MKKKNLSACWEIFDILLKNVLETNFLGVGIMSFFDSEGELKKCAVHDGISEN